MGRILWAWCFSCLLLVGFVASARADDPSMVVPICVRVPGIPDDVARNGWAFAQDGTTVVRMRREEFKKASRGLLVYRFDPAAPPENTKLLPIRYHQIKCDPYEPPPSTPVAPSVTPSAGPPPAPAAGGTKAAAPRSPNHKPAASEKGDAPGDAPPGLPPPIVYPKNNPQPKPRPPNNGVTTHWPATVLPVVQRSTDTHALVLPVGTVLPVVQPKVDTHTKVLPMAHVLPFKHEVGKGDGGKGDGGKGDGGKGDGGKGDAPNKVAEKTWSDHLGEQLALGGALATQQMNEDLKRPDGKQYGIPGGKNPNGPNNPEAQAAAGAALVVVAVLSAGGLERKIQQAVDKGTRLIIKDASKLAEDAAEKLVLEFVKRHGAVKGRGYLAATLNQNGAIGPYSVMKKFTDNLAGKWQAHHILEVKMFEKFNLGKSNLGPSVILTDAEHKAITAELSVRTANAKTTEELWKAYKRVYKDHPHWLEAIESYFVKPK